MGEKAPMYQVTKVSSVHSLNVNLSMALTKIGSVGFFIPTVHYKCIVFRDL